MESGGAGDLTDSPDQIERFGRVQDDEDGLRLQYPGGLLRLRLGSGSVRLPARDQFRAESRHFSTEGVFFLSSTHKHKHGTLLFYFSFPAATGKSPRHDAIRPLQEEGEVPGKVEGLEHDCLGAPGEPKNTDRLTD